MNKDEQEIYMKYLIDNLPNAKKAAGGSEVQCRCLYHNDHSQHMYLNIPENGSAAFFYCHNCGVRGLVTPSKLSEWNIYDDLIASLLLENAKEVKVTDKYTNKTSYILTNHIINDDDCSRVKLAYINKRLGTQLTFDDCTQLKICLNLKDLLYANRITNLTRAENIVNELDQYFVGFISADNAFVNLRRIIKEGVVYKSIDKRYVNYNIFNKYDTAERYYTVPTMVNAVSPSRIKLHIAEGPFDILSIYLNVRQREPGIYTSMAGNNYFGMIKHFILSLKLFNIEIHIYPDKPTKKDTSGSDENMQNIANICVPLNIPVYIHRNLYEGEKDFGVKPERIQEQIVQLGFAK